MFVYLLACIERPKHSALLVTKQRTFFNEKKIEIEAARRLLFPATTQEVGDEAREDNPKESRVDIVKEAEEEMEGNDEKEVNPEESGVDVQNETEENMHGNKAKSANSEEPRIAVQSEVKGKVDGNEGRESLMLRRQNLMPKVRRWTTM
jgi:hypothetical protein